MADKKEKKKNTGKTPVKKLRIKHDEVVKDFLSDKKTAESFFKEYLPTEVVRNLDFNTLQICKDSFLNKKLAKYFSDILYQANLNDLDLFIYLLIDHKSRKERFMSFQFLKYMVRIWELYLKQNKKAETLPVIIPIVIYHGLSEWKVDTRFSSLFKAPGYIKEYIPDFNINLFDISHVSDEEIKGELLLRILFFTLKYISKPELKYKLREEILPLFSELEDKAKRNEYLEVLLEYLSRSAGNLPEKELNDTVTQIFDEGGDLMATLSEKWMKQGEQKGKQEGKQEGKWDVVRNSLKEGLPIKTIERITGFPSEEIVRFKEKIAHIS